MANDLQAWANWTFTEKCDIPPDIDRFLVDGESAVCAYATIRDIAIFTNKRLIVKDSQGITGKKREIYTLPYSSIIMYSSENAGTLDLNAEIEMWTTVGKIKINVSRNAKIREIDKLIATYILK